MLQDYCIDENQTILEAIAAIQSNFSRCVIVLNSARRVVGVFSEGDVLRAILNRHTVQSPVRNVISGQFLSLKTRDLPLAFQLMRQKGITLIPIVKDNYELADVITISQILEQVRFHA